MLQNFGTALSREQMKNVKGGMAMDVTCVETTADGVEHSFTASGPSVDAIQDAHDALCETDNNCWDIDCGAKV
jgi:hypothetical protein